VVFAQDSKQTQLVCAWEATDAERAILAAPALVDEATGFVVIRRGMKPLVAHVDLPELFERGQSTSFKSLSST